MKFLLLFISVICATALSMLSVIYGTGRIPFTGDGVDAGAGKENESLSVFTSQGEVIEQLELKLKEKRDLYDKRVKDLSSKEQQIKKEQEVIIALQAELSSMAQRLDARIVDVETSEKANVRRLADVYSKMAPDSSARLLAEMAPERGAKILNQIGDRQAAAILDSSVKKGPDGIRIAAEWSGIIRRMKKGK